MRHELAILLWPVVGVFINANADHGHSGHDYGDSRHDYSDADHYNSDTDDNYGNAFVDNRDAHDNYGDTHDDYGDTFDDHGDSVHDDCNPFFFDGDALHYHSISNQCVLLNQQRLGKFIRLLVAH